ncbi:hypothetical protein [Methylobacterium ajmalii]|uniref:hypothetical protein n=1 Tax=Methylobacterium ajmalii TaxID=2738439 RepID=UPI002F3608D4
MITQAQARRAGKEQALYHSIACALMTGRDVFLMTDRSDEMAAGVRRFAPGADIERASGGLRISPGRTPSEPFGKKEIEASPDNMEPETRAVQRPVAGLSHDWGSPFWLGVAPPDLVP